MEYSGSCGYSALLNIRTGGCICKVTYSYSLLKAGIHKFLYGLIQRCNLVLKFKVVFFKLGKYKSKKQNKTKLLLSFRAKLFPWSFCGICLLYLPGSCVQYWIKEDRNTSNEGSYILSKANKKIRIIRLFDYRFIFMNTKYCRGTRTDRGNLVS